jgi:hypothetical protein
LEKSDFEIDGHFEIQACFLVRKPYKSSLPATHSWRLLVNVDSSRRVLSSQSEVRKIILQILRSNRAFDDMVAEKKMFSSIQFEHLPADECS